MSLPAWPVGLEHRPVLPQFRIAEPHVAPLETEFEGGSQRRRPRTTLRRALFAMTWRFSATEYGLFRTFYHRTLGEGTLRFTVDVLDGPSGECISRTSQFKGMYTAARTGTRWTVSAELYVFGNI